jgi:hypothetical protein
MWPTRTGRAFLMPWWAPECDPAPSNPTGYDRKDIAGKSPEDKMVRIGYKGTASSRKFPGNRYYEYSPCADARFSLPIDYPFSYAHSLSE